MAFSDGTNGVFKVKDSGGSLTDISAYLDKAGLQRSAAAYDVTTLGKTSKVFIAGLKDGKVPVSGEWDPTIDGVLAGILGNSTTKDYEYYPSGVGTGSVKYSGTCILIKYDIDDSVDAEVTFSGEFQLSDTVTRAIV